MRVIVSKHSWVKTIQKTSYNVYPSASHMIDSKPCTKKGNNPSHESKGKLILLFLILLLIIFHACY